MTTRCPRTCGARSARAPTPADPLRVAVVGYGLGGSVFHAPLIDALPRLSLDVIVTGDADRRQAAKHRYPSVAVVPGLADVVERAEALDLVVVTVPNAAHVTVAAAALSAGLAVVMDKPVTPTAAEARHLHELAAVAGVAIIPYHNRRWDGDFLTVADLIAGGRLGPIWRYESRFERWRPAPVRTGSWKQDASQAGGGILYDLGSHLVDQAIALFGPPAAVYGELASRTGVLDDDAFVALSYHAGPPVHLWVSSTAAAPGPRFRVLGSRAAFVKSGLDPQEGALRSGASPGGAGWGEEEPEAWGRLGTIDGTEAVETRPGDYPAFYAGVAACLLDGAAPPVAWEDAVTGLAVIEAARESARTGETVRLD